MRFILIFLIHVVVLTGRLYSQTASGMLSFEEKVFDFGKILEKNGKVSHSFTFKNTGREPVVIDEIVSGCGCTGHEYTKGPVLPGQEGKVIITYDPLYRPGFFSKEIVIYSNNHKNMNRVWIKGNVIPYQHPVEEDYPYHFGSGLYLSLKVLAFGKIEEGKSKQIKLRYANDSDRTITLNFFVDGNDRNITFTDPGKLSPGERGEMIFRYSQSKATHKDILIHIYPVINGERSLVPLEAKISAGILPK
jgi:hypothetical protein